MPDHAIALAAASVWDQLRHGLIVSCQAEGADPFNRPQYLALFAQAAEQGGAVGIRAQGGANIAAIQQAVRMPIIGLTKDKFPDGSVLITAGFVQVEEIVHAGAAIVAVDATDRMRENGLRGPEFVSVVKEICSLPVLADVSTLDEGLCALDAGADAVATTLAGYTPATTGQGDEPNWDLLRSLTQRVRQPVIAEGRIWTPAQAQRALELGAHAVVVGTAITRPRVVTRKFADAMKSAIGRQTGELSAG